MRHHEGIIKAAQEDGAGVVPPVGEDAEKFLVQRVLFHAEVVVKPRLRAPADVEGGVDVRLRPFHDLAKFVPVLHFLKFEVLHRRAGDDETVEALVFYVLEGLVEGEQVFGADVFRLVGAGVQKGELHLQRRVAQQPRELRLGDDLRGHEV